MFDLPYEIKKDLNILGLFANQVKVTHLTFKNNIRIFLGLKPEYLGPCGSAKARYSYRTKCVATHSSPKESMPNSSNVHQQLSPWLLLPKYHET